MITIRIPNPIRARRAKDPHQRDLSTSPNIPNPQPPTMPPKKPDPAQQTLSFFARRPLPPSSSQIATSDPFEPLNRSSRAPSLAPTAPPPRVLAVDIPASTLRPIAFRVFTKKHNLTLKSDALSLLCGFIGRRCGADWRDSGSGEKLLDEIAKQWKRNEGAGKILVDGGDALKGVLKGIEVAGREAKGRTPGLSRSTSFDFSAGEMIPSSMLMGGDPESQDVEMMSEEVRDSLEGVDPTEYLRIVDVFEMPKLMYNASRRIFERHPRPSLFPPPAAKTALFRHRYNLIHARLLRNESFMAPTYEKKTSTSTKKSYKLTPISALLGRYNQDFMLFGMLSITPSGTLSLYDPTGEVSLDLTYCHPNDTVWLCPGMLILLNGTYEESEHFTVFAAISPPIETRAQSAEIFGHVDFLGTGVPLDFSISGGGPQGRAMRKIEKALTDPVWLIASDVHLDQSPTLSLLRGMLTKHAEKPPQVIILCGPFSSAPLASREYKACFDSLAAVFAEFPGICEESTLLLVPADSDPWTMPTTTPVLPRPPLPKALITRVMRTVKRTRAVSNPVRIAYFTSEVVVVRDDVQARLRRNAVRVGVGEKGERDEMEVDDDDAPSHSPSHDASSPSTTTTATAPLDTPQLTTRKLVKTLLDQSTLSPFPLTVRPVLTDFASHALSLYPLPSTVVMADAGVEQYRVTYEGCHVLNPGSLGEERVCVGVLE
ncbi:hypothetical protein EX30DRAFT_100979 [Ascodesmis nigricans]|uniref:DNA polymerase epsilon subunit B n=1 Tax=Ascodesmis nigricans TaxID=341454 RepID=A0A4S2N504_9PEZI|nr:hypothetical protein EX30DRAFT_100979 [Ascodesmis nigricans]